MLPAYEDTSDVVREDRRAYPADSITELTANAFIHQNFDELGFLMVEIYSDRVKISNPGLPLIIADRFIDEYQSRNEDLADIMRRMGFCEEKGSGIGKTIICNEEYKLPAIEVMLQEFRTVVRMRSSRPIGELNSQERRKACYQHACVKYVLGDKMTNQSLCVRLGIEDRSYAVASKIIKDAINANLIKEDDPEMKSRRLASYLPFWA